MTAQATTTTAATTTAAITTTSAIEVRGLRKSFGKQLVLDGIDLDVAPGTVFALLGPNGAGKTTVVHILSTLISADAGEVRIGGFDVASQPNAVRGLIGLTGQVSAVDGQFTGEENLRLMADLYHLGKDAGRRKVAELLERFDLVADATKPAMTYSGGMRRRLDLAMTLVGDPKIIFLDEPTTGLDPRSRRVMWEIVRELVASGVTIFLTTQYLEEADRLASRIALLDGGRVVAQGTPAELKRLVPGRERPARVRRRGGARPCCPGARQRHARRPGSRARAWRTTAASSRCGTCSTGWTRTPSRSMRSRSGPPTSTTSSSPSPAAATASTTKGCRPHDRLRDHRLDDHAPAEPPPDAPLPIADVLRCRDARGVPAPVRLRVRRDPRRGARRPGRGRRSAPRPTARPGAMPTWPTCCRGS